MERTQKDHICGKLTATAAASIVKRYNV